MDIPAQLDYWSKATHPLHVDGSKRFGCQDPEARFGHELERWDPRCYHCLLRMRLVLAQHGDQWIWCGYEYGYLAEAISICEQLLVGVGHARL